jgi:hypothetical protein
MGRVAAHKMVNLLFLMGLMKGELLSMKIMICENLSSSSQVHVTAILGTEDFLL